MLTFLPSLMEQKGHEICGGGWLQSRKLETLAAPTSTDPGPRRQGPKINVFGFFVKTCPRFVRDELYDLYRWRGVVAEFNARVVVWGLKEGSA
jgi:hypothetical protein